MPKSTGALEMKVTIFEGKIARMVKENEQILMRYDRRISEAKARKQQSQVEALTAERKQRAKLFEDYASDARARLAKLLEELVEAKEAKRESQKQLAAQREASAKRLAFAQWEGDPDVFEESWPIIWRLREEDRLAETARESERRRVSPPAASL